MTVISRAKKLVEEVGKEEAIKIFEKEIEKFGEVKNFSDLCVVTGLETAIQYIKDEIDDTVKTFNSNTMRNSAYTAVKTLTDQELYVLLIEMKKIRSVEAPALKKQSSQMKELFSLEKTDYNSWSDQCSNVKQAIEIEILTRIETNGCFIPET